MKLFLKTVFMRRVCVCVHTHRPSGEAASFQVTLLWVENVTVRTRQRQGRET